MARRWAAQYAGSQACSALSQPPVWSDSIGRDGGLSRRVATWSANLSTTGSTSAECAPALMCSRRTSTPPRSRSAASRAVASRGPDTTHWSGPLTAAMSSPGASRSRSSASGSDTAIIAPGANPSSSRPRAATSATAPGRSNTPATQPAA